MQGMSFTGGATHTWELTRAAYDYSPGYNRIIILTDEQAYSSGSAYSYGGGYGRTNDSSWVPAHVPVFSWDLAGHKTVSFELGRGRYQFAGLNDASFGLIKMLESGATGRWPWE